MDLQAGSETSGWFVVLWVNKDVPRCSPSLEACSRPAPARKSPQVNARLAESTSLYNWSHGERYSVKTCDHLASPCGAWQC